MAPAMSDCSTQESHHESRQKQVRFDLDEEQEGAVDGHEDDPDDDEKQKKRSKINTKFRWSKISIN